MKIYNPLKGWTTITESWDSPINRIVSGVKDHANGIFGEGKTDLLMTPDGERIMLFIPRSKVDVFINAVEAFNKIYVIDSIGAEMNSVYLLISAKRERGE